MSHDGVESGWPKARRFLNMDRWYDRNMPLLPRWTAADLAKFSETHPRSGDALTWLRWQQRMTIYTGLLGGGGVVAFALMRTRNPIYASLGFVLGGAVGLLYGGDVPAAYTRLRFGHIDKRRVQNEFLSWWREQQHEKFYAVHPERRPGAAAHK